ncbi:unnamed protein product [Clavelina lepadiformis]|uniref:Uncharacterized protein n=1 Tax=Clavelina lepadiformis TaxID=159417 RepID=A0ABP0G7R2_CLALP
MTHQSSYNKNVASSSSTTTFKLLPDIFGEENGTVEYCGAYHTVSGSHTFFSSLHPLTNPAAGHRMRHEVQRRYFVAWSLPDWLLIERQHLMPSSGVLLMKSFSDKRR